MDREAGPAGGNAGPREGKGSDKFLLDKKELGELESDFEDFSTDDHNEDTQDLLDKIKQHYDCRRFFPAYPACMSQENWEIRQGGEEMTRPCSMTECWVCHDKRRNAAECVRNSSHHDCSLTFSFCPSVPLSRPVTASTMSSLINYSCGPISPPKDAFMVTSTYPSSSKWGPVSVAAHLHLLGEALCLIGLHLKSTNKLVSVSNSLSLLLDSVLCALAPLTFLTAEIPELGSCTQHTLASTLENIAYLMPGM